MENKPKKSKALIITIIALILLLIAGYLIFKNRDAFGVKTSASIAKIFSPLMSSTNSKNLTTVQAGEDIKKGDNISVFGTGTNNVPIVMKTTGNNSVFGSAYEDINSGNTGQITPNNNSNSFWNSFANFLGGMFTNNPPNPTVCTLPKITDTDTGQCINPSQCLAPKIINGNKCEDNTVCTLPKITDTDTGQCIDPSQCLAPKVINGNRCENPSGGDPDLIAGNVTPTGTTINTAITLSSTITNIGGSSTVTSFSNFFTIEKTLGTATPVEIAVITPVLEAKTGSIAEITYTFSTAGEYQIRVCAEKKDSADAGTITESDEGNNCSAPTIFTVTDSLPQPCLSPKITNVSDGMCIDPSDCKSPKVVNGDKCEDSIECLSPKITDTDTGQCIDPSQCLAPKVINENNCEKPLTPYVNECLLIDKNPLTFTDNEQAQLDELLRKFYLIAPNLKTEDDINIAYSTITQYQNFSEQLSTLINQCYEQGVAKPVGQEIVGVVNPNYKGPTLRFGNPWYKYNVDKFRGSYIDKTFDCKYVSGWFTGNGADGKDCDTYNKELYSQTKASCTSPFTAIKIAGRDHLFGANATQHDVYVKGLNNKCVWNPGARISDMEKISNVW